LKILQVTSEIYPNSKGGIGKVVDILSEKLSKKDNDVTVLCSNNKSLDNDARRYKLVFYKTRFKIWGNPIGFDFLKQNYKKFDVIHLHSHLVFHSFVIAIISKIANIPSVITIHGLYSQTAPRKISEIWLNTLSRIIFKCSAKIICLTQADSSITKNYVNELKVVVIGNGVNADRFDINKEMLEKNFVLFVGRFVRGKGVYEVIEAFNRILNEFKGIKLIMIGSGPEEENIKKIILNLNLQAKIKLMKNVKEEKLIEFYQQTKFLLLPSYTEGLPLVLLEGMSCGSPIITSNIPQLINLIEGCGLSVEVKNVNNLVEAMSKLLKDEELRIHFRKNARKKIEEEYSWDVVVDKTIDVYNSIKKR
jgi:glycosyltransferase involved in cell wall biosynthesis